ncbi:hypothetical protein H2203_008917 [Taxawa tesnikishii (nom. ined.)]|nr:hypothetical protein H2203_008917 [Dothideales sp. JES 119]
MPAVDPAPLGTTRKIICFSGTEQFAAGDRRAPPAIACVILYLDFDGTIFMQDTGHILFNAFGCGSEKRQVLDQQIHSGERSFRDNGFEAMKEALEIDPDFQTFHTFCLNNKIPFNVISAGLKPVLRSVLDHFLGEEASSNIDIVANDADISEDGSNWKPIWRHDTELGHDKALSINEYKDAAKLESEDGTIPMIVFIGDGVSDLPAAREADVLFARRGLRLEEYCIEHKLPYIPFDTFADIQREVIKIAKVDEVKTKGRGLPSNFNPRANLWRRASSKNAVPIFAAKTPRDEKMFIWPEAFSELKTKEAPVAPVQA